MKKLIRKTPHPRGQRVNLKFVFTKQFLESQNFGSLKTSIYSVPGGGAKWWLTFYFNVLDEFCYSMSCYCDSPFTTAQLSASFHNRKVHSPFAFKRGFGESRKTRLCGRDHLFNHIFKNGNKYFNILINGRVFSHA